MNKTDITIAICNRCGSSNLGSELASRLAPVTASEGLRIETVSCFASCDRALSVAVSSPGKASYLFGDINPKTDGEALVEFCRLYRSLHDGWCRESERPRALRGKTLARIPFFPPPEQVSS